MNVPEILEIPEIGTDPRDAKFTIGQVMSLRFIKNSVGAQAYNNALQVARANVQRDIDTIAREQERNLHRWAAQNLPDEQRIGLMDLSDIPDEATRTRIIGLRSCPYQYAAALGEAREAARKAAKATTPQS